MHQPFVRPGVVLQKQCQEVFLGRCFRAQELGARGAGGDFPGGREEPVAPAFDVPGGGSVAVREGGELEPGDEVEGQRGGVRPAWFAAKSKNGSLPRPLRS